MTLEIYTASAARPGGTYHDAIRSLKGCSEWFGELNLGKVQVCPQHRQRLDSQVIDTLLCSFPDTQFRLHANCWVHSRRLIRDLDLSNLSKTNISLFKPLATAHSRIGGDVYSLHAGYKSQCERESLQDHLKRAEDLFECPVAVEPLYPSDKEYHLSSYDDLKWLLDNELPFALDMSHYQIIARHNNFDFQLSLLMDLLTSPNCLEVHISDNNGMKDSHATITQEPWFWKYLVKAKALGSKFDVFTEGNQNSNQFQIKQAHRFQKSIQEKIHV